MPPAARTRCLAVLLLAAAALGQAPAPPHRGASGANDPRLAAGAGARAGFVAVDPRGAEVVATGSNWRAVFDDRGFTFLPALGKRAPRAYPLHCRLESIRRDGEQPPADAAPPLRQHDKRGVTFARGTVTERYAARPADLEQSFVFAERPAGQGDLVVRLAVATDLPAADAADGGLRWAVAGIGGVALGAVTGIDADGRRVPGCARRAGTAVELVLPAAFVDGSRYPLVLDPTFGTAIDAFPNADCDFPDAAYDPYTDAYCVVWTMYFGGSSSAAIGSVYRASDLANAYAFQVGQAGDQDNVRVANINGTGMFVMVWANYANNAIEISGLALDPGQAYASYIFSLAGPGAVYTPAIGGEATPFGNSAVVIWNDATYGVVGSTVTVDFSLNVSLGNPVLIGGGATAYEPTISKQGGGPGLYVIAWADRPAGLPGWIRAQVVDYSLNVLGPGVWIENNTQNAARPAVDGDGFLFFIAWDEQELANPASTDVLGRCLTVSQAGITTQGPVLPVAAYPRDVDGGADVAVLGDKFGVVYQSAALNSLYTDDVYFRPFARNGTPIGREIYVDLTATGHYVFEHGPRLVSRRDGDYATAADDGLMVFADQDTTTIDSNVGLQVVGAMGAGGPVQDLGGGCGPGGLMTGNGAFALGNVDFEYQLYGVGPLAIPFLFLGFGGPPLQCGVCTVTDPFAVVFFANTAGTAIAALPLPGDPILFGLTVEAQWVTLNVAYVGCPTAPGVAASNRLQAQLGY
jgi:hypothetical protein